MAEFKPPLNNPLARLAVSGFFVLARRWLHYQNPAIAESDLEKLRALKGKRVILCPNHSCPHDPGVIYLLQDMLGERFNFVAAREIFDRWHGLLGWLMQGVGTYSVDRRTVDRRSVATSMRLIGAGSKLVIFPECELSYRNDRLLPIDPRVAGLFTRSAATLRRSDPHEPLYVVPIGLVYKYLAPIESRLNNALVRLELALGLTNHKGGLTTRFERARLLVLKRAKIDASNRARLQALSSFSETPALTAESLAAGIDLCEREMFGRVSEKGHRQATIKVGDPIEVTAAMDPERLTAEIDRQLRSLIGITPERIVRANAS